MNLAVSGGGPAAPRRRDADALRGRQIPRRRAPRSKRRRRPRRARRAGRGGDAHRGAPYQRPRVPFRGRHRVGADDPPGRAADGAPRVPPRPRGGRIPA